jgi:enamine deaminase RidA (YjgF/YER057c/UK114 family)
MSDPGGTRPSDPAATPRSPPGTTLTQVEPAGWPRPRGYANGVVARGRTLFVAGQIGWRPDGTFTSDDLVDQFGQALDNVLAVVRAAGGGPEHVARMTVYVTDLPVYRASLERLGPVWRAHMGRCYPAMALVGVAGLVEQQAKVEIEATAVLP